MSGVCEDNVKTLVAVIASGFLIISEILPYLKFIRGNGIIDVVTQVVTKHRANNNHDPERQMLYDALE